MINDNEVVEERELHIPIRLNYYTGDNNNNNNNNNNNEIRRDNRNTWPINSDEARLLRREFVQEGFRRLYRSAVASSLGQNCITSGDAAVTSINGSFGGNEGGEDEEIVAAFDTLGSIFGTLINGIKMTFGVFGSLVDAVGAINDVLATDFRQTEVNNGVNRDLKPKEEEWMYYAQ